MPNEPFIDVCSVEKIIKVNLFSQKKHVVLRKNLTDMKQIQPPKPVRYIDLLSDYGFKFVFGSEPNKDLLIHFLNEIFVGHKHIDDIQYYKTEFPGTGENEGVVIFDLLCTGNNGEQFLIEVQRASQEYFVQRSVSYVSRLISEQIPRGKRSEWEYDIKEVYFIAILETFSLDSNDKRYLRTANIRCCETNKVFYAGLKFIFIELCNFVKENITDKDSDLDKWLYVLKNMSRLDKMPLYLRKPVFQKLFQISEYSKLQNKERTMYDLSIRHKWDYDNCLKYAIKEAKKEAEKEGMEKGMKKGVEKGVEKGVAKGKEEIVCHMICNTKMTDIQISEMTGIEVSIVKNLRNNISTNGKSLPKV